MAPLTSMTSTPTQDSVDVVDTLPLHPAIKFLRWLHPRGPWPLTAIHPERRAIETCSFWPSNGEAASAWITARNGTWNLYYSVAELLGAVTKKASREDVARVVALHVDLDPRAGDDLGAEQDRILASLRAFNPAPSCVVFSGGGCQALWKLAQPLEIGGDLALAENAKRYNIALERSLGGDHCHDVTRILRLPDTVNVPDQRKREKGRVQTTARVIDLREELVHDLATFVQAAALAKPSAGTVISIARNVPRLASLDELPAAVPDAIKVLITKGHHPDEPNRYASRSEALFAACCALVRAGVSEEQMLGVLLNPAFKISESVFTTSEGKARRDPHRYALKQIASARAAVLVEGGSADKPIIKICGGALPAIVDAAENALLANRCELYQRGDADLVRPVRLERAEGSLDAGEVVRAAGSVILRSLAPVWLREQMARAAVWLRYDARASKWRPADPPMDYANTYLARAGEWRVPNLAGVVQTPTLRADGSILQTPGYDASSQVLFEPGGVAFPTIPDCPTKDQAEEALRLLEEPFRMFPFVSPADGSVVLAAMLTGLVRRSLPAAPLFGLDATTPGTGKSLLCESIGVVITGTKPAHMAQGKSSEEDEKRLSTVLMAGDQIISIDNCDRAIEGDFLCSMLTQERVQARILGLSERRLLPSNVLVLATGNNLRFVGDVTRRVLHCRLDAECEHPEDRQFDFSPVDTCRARRPKLVAAALTVLRAYLAADRPARLPSIGSFERWNFVREALCWLDRADPALTRERVKAGDSRRAEHEELLAAWYAACGDRWVTVRELSRLSVYDEGKWDADSRLAREAVLAQSLVELGGDRSFNARKVGWRLKELIDRWFGRHVLRQQPDEGRGCARWRVERRPEE